MFLHLGGSSIVDLNKIIVVLNLDKIEHPGKYLNMLREEEKKKGRILEEIAEGEPKSLIITDNSLILSPISSLTLKKRVNRIPIKDE
ncbi:MAG TPA: extracellular matrix/biofilm biosynthesis regulator RemA family protein [Bacillota bacterium]